MKEIESEEQHRKGVILCCTYSVTDINVCYRSVL